MLSSPNTSDKHNFGLFSQISCDFMGFHVISWDFMGFHETSWDFMGFHGTSWDFMGFHGISWDFMGHHGISCDFFLFFLEICVFWHIEKNFEISLFSFMGFPAHLLKQPQPWNGLSSQTTLHIQWAVQPIILWAFQPNYYTFLGPSLNCEPNHFKYSMGSPAQSLQFELALPDLKFILVLSSPDQNKLTQI